MTQLKLTYRRDENTPSIKRQDEEIEKLKQVWRDEVIFKTRDFNMGSSIIISDEDTLFGLNIEVFKPFVDAEEIESVFLNSDPSLSPRLEHAKLPDEEEESEENDIDTVDETSSNFEDVIEDLREKAGIGDEPEPDFE